jgi:hypothetical protein
MIYYCIIALAAAISARAQQQSGGDVGGACTFLTSFANTDVILRSVRGGQEHSISVREGCEVQLAAVFRDCAFPQWVFFTSTDL